MTKEINAGTSVEASSKTFPSQESEAVENASSAHNSQAVDAMEIVHEPKVSTDAPAPAPTPAPSKGLEKELLALRDSDSPLLSATNSAASSNRSNNHAGANGMGGAAYGTRSRNRSSTSRPNYAEDKETDVDIEIAAAMKEGRKAARANDSRPSASTDNTSSITPAKKTTAPESEPVATTQNNNKEPIPGTSTFSANPSAPTTQNSKKKKPPAHPAANATPSLSQNAVQNGSSTHTNSLRVNMAMHESNMLTFDNCGARLKDEKLVADDGTILSVNDHVYLVFQVKKVLDERWKYIIVEAGRGKEYTSAVKTCKRCSRYSASKAQEKKLEARNTPNITDGTVDAEDDEMNEDEDDFPAAVGDALDNPNGSASDSQDVEMSIHPGTVEQTRARHQANVPAWPGRPVEYVKAVEIKKKYIKGGSSSHRKDAKLSKETIAALEADKIAREKKADMATLLFKIPEVGEASTSAERGMDDEPSSLGTPAYEQLINDYMIRAKAMAKPLGLPEFSTNLLDVALQLLYSNNFDIDKALEALSTTEKKTFKEPELSSAELEKIRGWNKGKQVWGNYSGRKGKKEAKKAEAALGKLQDDIADDHDDSAFDNDKVLQKKKGFQCKFCSIRSSQRWRRAPSTPAGTTVPENPNSKGAAKEKGNQLVLALCQRCAELWRRYAIQYEDIDEVAKKVAASGGRASKRKMDEEFLRELKAANEGFGPMEVLPPTAPLSTGSTPAPAPPVSTPSEPPKKKAKPNSDIKETPDSALENGATATPAQPKKKPIVEKPPPPPPPPPEAPKPKILPCANVGWPCIETATALLIIEVPSKWTCDMCLNDKDPKVSIQYKCMLCPVEFTEHDFVEPPKISHKKKTEKERERDRLERENALKAADYFRKKQEELNRPVNPREPLKRTANNNWVHVTCAVFTPEVKFGDAKALVPSEGIPSIPSSRYDEVCKACKKKGGACVNCPFMSSSSTRGLCASEWHNIVNINGEMGAMSAAIWCKEHVPTKTIVHRMHDVVDETGLNALQLYVQNFKQADLALTGTVRKANLVNQSTRAANSVNVGTSQNRRTSTTGVSASAPTNRRASLTLVKVEDSPVTNPPSVRDSEKTCVTCSVDVSPKWWPMIEVTAVTSSPAAPLNAILDHDPTTSDSPALTNGQLPNGLMVERNGVHVALAAAALHQNTQKPAPVPTEFQCHQCHWKKIRKQPTPTPTPSPIPIPIASDREVSRPPVPLPIPTSAPVIANIPPLEPERHRAPHQYPWPPQPPSYPSTSPYNSWPRHSPVPTNVAIAHQVNGNHSPRMPGIAPQLGGPPHGRQPMQGLQPSPHQNGRIPQAPNGYQPPSHHLPGPPPIHMQNGGYGSYVSNRPPPHHLNKRRTASSCTRTPFLAK
ncbi:hypothetical protein DID88_007721 [Monilinia fructigena]|uniref:PHD-type domain-containing protein n=1 Tax=Monilinia fructigena TaxID=38457 RepID=A0A395J8A9_9HELO|nr:hypothetical protein DID88_007721 [Monilinia fructigena]